MRRNRIRVLLIASLFAAAGFAAAPASAQQPYDGLWQVTVVTKTGSCDAQTTSTLTVTEGKISAPARRSPAASAAGVLCESRSMVHMRTVNSVATPDRGSGMAHQRAFRAAVDGKLPVSKTADSRIFVFRGGCICSRRFFCGIDRGSFMRQAGGPYRRYGRKLVRRRHHHAG